MPTTTTYTWDEENRLESVSVLGGGSESYTYSSDGLRRSKTKTNATGSTLTKYLWDGKNLLQEQDSSLNPIAQYTYQPDGYGPILSQRRATSSSSGATFNQAGFGSVGFNSSSTSSGAEESFFYAFDLSGNTRVLTDESGSATDSYVSTAFGEDVSSTGSTPNPYRFGGQVGYYLDSSQRIYVRARHLYTSQGKWISRDPIGFSGGDWNLYRYVGNEPAGLIDPSGLDLTDTILSSAEGPYRNWSAAKMRQEVRRAGANGVYPLFIMGTYPTNPSNAFATMSIPKKAEYIRAMLGEFKGSGIQGLIRSSASSNCIPAWLLASIVIAELIDRKITDWADYTSHRFNRNHGGIGPAQVSINTAVTHRPPKQKSGRQPNFLFDTQLELRQRRYGLSPQIDWESEESLRLEAGSVLLTYQGSIEAAAREISYLIDKVLDRRSKTPMTTWAVKSTCDCSKILANRCKDPNILVTSKCFKFVAPGISIHGNKPKPIRVINDPQLAMVKAIGALYNSGLKASPGRIGDFWFETDAQSERSVYVAKILEQIRMYQ